MIAEELRQTRGRRMRSPRPRADDPTRKRRLAFAAAFGAAALLNLGLMLSAPCVQNVSISDGPAEAKIPAQMHDSNGNHTDSTKIPTVACFFMVDRKSEETALSVRYSNWGKRCSHFVIVSNGVSGGGERFLDGNTVLVDSHYTIKRDLEARGLSEKYDTSNHTRFPSPEDEGKQNLAKKAFYSWMYVIRRYGDEVDFIMKADQDTYVLMDNYLRYLSDYFSPEQPALIGRVFKADGRHGDSFVTGLSITLSRSAAKLFLAKSTIDSNADGDHECSAQTFEWVTHAEDHSLSKCLSTMGIYPAYTRDELGRERFMHYDPVGDREPPGWYDEFSFTPRGPPRDCCSSEACAFHYVEPGRQNDTLVWDETFGSWYWNESGVETA